MTPMFEFIRAWQALGKGDTLTLNFEKFKERYHPMLAFCIEDMNWKFGEGEISDIIFNLNECDIDKEYLYGRVHRKGCRRRNKKYKRGQIVGNEDDRFFKLENGHVVFLSHRRKLMKNEYA